MLLRGADTVYLITITFKNNLRYIDYDMFNIVRIEFIPPIALSHRLELFNQIIISLDLFESLQKGYEYCDYKIEHLNAISPTLQTFIY
jgi:hypothetical protein